MRVIVAPLILAAFAVGGARAEERVVSARVSHADLALAQPDDRDRLHDRVARAARKLCRSDLSHLDTGAQERRCRRHAIADAAPQIAGAVERSLVREAAENRSGLPVS